MKKNIFLTTIAALAFASCDLLTPRPIDSDNTYEDYETTSEESPYDQSGYSSSSSNPTYTLPDAQYDNRIRSMIRDFYAHYYSRNASDSEKFKATLLRQALDDIERYELNTGYIVLEGDPFIGAQDVVGGLATGQLNINKVNDENSTDWGAVTIVLQVVLENGKPKIYDVGVGDSSILKMASEL